MVNLYISPNRAVKFIEKYSVNQTLSLSNFLQIFMPMSDKSQAIQPKRNRIAAQSVDCFNKVLRQSQKSCSLSTPVAVQRCSIKPLDLDMIIKVKMCTSLGDFLSPVTIQYIKGNYLSFIFNLDILETHIRADKVGEQNEIDAYLNL